jgi:hypothetical protein
VHKKDYDTHAHTSSWYPAEEWGNLSEGVTGDRKCGMSLNMFSDSGRNKRNIAYMQQCSFHWSNCCETWKIWRGIPDLFTIGQNYWTLHEKTEVHFILASAIKSQW